MQFAVKVVSEITFVIKSQHINGKDVFLMQSVLNEAPKGTKLNVDLRIDRKSEALWLINFTNAFKNFGFPKIRFNKLTLRVLNGEFYGQAIP